MKRGWLFLLMLGLTVTSVGLLGCSSSDDGDDPAPAGQDGSDGEDGADGADGADAVVDDNVQVGGTWKGTRSNEDGASNFTMTLSQSGDALTGGYSDGSGFEGTVTGSIEGDDLDLTILINDAPAPWDTPLVWSLNGAVNASGDDMSATLNAGSFVNAVDATKQ
jgi:hypothetical protein